MIDYAEIMYRKKMNMLKAAFIRDAVFIGFGIIMLNFYNYRQLSKIVWI